MEAFTRGMFKALRIHPATREHGLVFRGEVFADHGDDANISEVTCGQSEVSGRTAQAPVAPTLGCLDAVKCNTAYDKNGHGFLSVQELYLPNSKSNLLRVAAGIASRLVRMANCRAVGQAQVRSRGMAATAARTALAAFAEF
jgi:hypothetical protein